MLFIMISVRFKRDDLLVMLHEKSLATERALSSVSTLGPVSLFAKHQDGDNQNAQLEAS